MTNEQKIIATKLGLLKLAETLGNLSEACKVLGYSRDSFYRFKEFELAPDLPPTTRPVGVRVELVRCHFTGENVPEVFTQSGPGVFTKTVPVMFIQNVPGR